MLDNPEWRIPQPRSDNGREMAEEVWKRRHEMPLIEAKIQDSSKDSSVKLAFNSTLQLYISDGTHEQFAMRSRQSYRSSANGNIQYDHYCHSAGDDRCRWVVHAWRAAQAARFLRILNEDEEIYGAPLCVKTPDPDKVIFRLAMKLMPKRAATASEVLEERLDKAIRKRIETMPPLAPMTDKLDIGNGITLDAATWAPILCVSHQNHGNYSLPGEAAKILNHKINAVRERTLATVAGPEERIDRVMAICREALSLNPSMTDNMGTPIAPLLEKHLPRLSERRRSVLASTKPEDRVKIEKEIEETLSLVSAAVEEGMASQAQLDRDRLRTELHFLSMRHPVSHF